MFTYRLLFLNLFIFLIYTDSSSFQMFAARRDEVYVYFFLACNVDVLKVSIPGSAVTKIFELLNSVISSTVQIKSWERAV